MEKLREQYEKEVVPALMKKFQYKSIMQVPKLDKVVINIGLGDTKENLIPAPFPDAYLKLNSSTFSKSSVINNDVFS